jgi:DNA modification methylase
MVLVGDCLEILPTLEVNSVQCVVTSPPYYGLRDYGVEGQLGLEKTPEEYVSKIVEIFREVRRVLREDGTLWLNLGDSYWGGKGKSSQAWSTEHTDRGVLQAPQHQICGMGETRPTDGKHDVIKPKDLIGIPWRVAFALQADGWWLRQDVIWHKPNPMPESVRDRCTKSHEYIFLLTKSARYYYDAEAIKEPIKDSSAARLMQDIENQEGSDRVPGKTNGNMKAVLFGGNNRCPDTRLQSGKEWTPKMAGGGSSYKNGHSGYFKKDGTPLTGIMANKKSVWNITTKPFKEAHFATFPPEIPEICIKAGSRVGDTILDPFAGAGTTGMVAEKLNRKFIGIELNPEYAEMAERRIYAVAPLFQEAL